MTDDPAPQHPVPTAPAFNLLDEPWIPVRFADGTTRELGLLELFERSRVIEALAEPSPPEFVALHRLLLAITHRALVAAVGHWNDDDRASWFDAGLPAGALRDYLSQWRERFWLFHPTHPFMQVAALAHDDATRGNVKPWTTISLAHASGDTPVVFDHSVSGNIAAIEARHALTLLLGYLQFIPGGLVQALRTADKGGPLANSLAVVPQGSNLEQSLLFGLHPPMHDDSDLPAWERPAPTIEDLRRTPTLATGAIDRYTRLARAILFLPENVGRGWVVANVWFAAGIALADDANDLDPFTPYRVTDDGLVAVRFVEGRAFWRDLGALLPTPATGNDNSIGPRSVSLACRLESLLLAKQGHLTFAAAGVSSGHKPAKLARWRIERHVIPISLLSHEDHAAFLRNALVRAERLYARLLAIAAEMSAEARPKVDTKTRAKRIRAWTRANKTGELPRDDLSTSINRDRLAAAFFAPAERALPQLQELLAGGDFEAAYAKWTTSLLRSAYGAWNAASELLGHHSAALRARALMQQRFDDLVRPLRPASAPETTAMEHYP